MIHAVSHESNINLQSNIKDEYIAMKAGMLELHKP